MGARCGLREGWNGIEERGWEGWNGMEEREGRGKKGEVYIVGRGTYGGRAGGGAWLRVVRGRDGKEGWGSTEKQR